MSNNPRRLRPQLTSIDDVIKSYAKTKLKANDSVHLIQVGANDGKINDPVHKYIMNYSWKGILF